MTKRPKDWPSNIASDIALFVQVGESWLADSSNPHVTHDMLYEIDGKTWILSGEEWARLLELFIRFVPAMDPFALQRLAVIAHYSDLTTEQIRSLCERVAECAEVGLAIEFADLILHRLENEEVSLQDRRRFIEEIVQSGKFVSKEDEDRFTQAMAHRLTGE